MRIRGTLAALAVLAGLGVVIWLDHGRDARREAEEKEAGSLLGAAFTSGKEVQGIDLTAGDSTIGLRRQGESWGIVSPVEAPGDAGSIEGIISTLLSARITRRIEEPAPDRSEYGLDPPEMLIDLHGAPGDPGVRIDLGAESPVGGGRYASIGGGEGIFVISAGAGRLVGKSLDDFRYRAVVDARPVEIESFAVTRGDSRVSFERSDGGWRLASPVDCPADAGKVASRLFELTSLRADGFAPQGAAPEDLGLDRPDLVLDVAMKEGPALQVRMAEEGHGGGWWALRNDMEQVFGLSAASASVLSIEPDEFMDLRVAPVEPGAITEITAERGGERKTVVKDAGATWRWGGRDGAAMDPGAVDDLIGALDAARADRYVAGAHPRAGTPRLRLSVRAGAADPVVVEVGEPCGEGGCPVTSSASGLVYEVPVELIDRLEGSVSSIGPPGPATAGQETRPGGDPPS